VASLYPGTRISIDPSIQVIDTDRTSHCAALPSVLGFDVRHHALRKRNEETVMSVRRAPVSRSFEWDVPVPFVDRQALDDLFSVTYEELRRLASSVRRGDRNATLSPTALVNEAWLKLANAPAFQSASRLHFKRIAARAMRQILIEAARRRRASKRGGDDFSLVTYDDTVEQGASTGRELLALDAALDDLAHVNPRQALLVESRYFGGFDVAETAELLDVSEATVLRDWRAARAWLASEIARTPAIT
jgi:RNA polymerase sigma-70 factor, ECF subfamily